MTAATERVPRDRAEAMRRLDRASDHAASAAACSDIESAFILLYSAVHKSLSAVLLADGYRVTAGTRGHAVLIAEAGARLPTETAALLRRIDRARRKRNDVSYETANVSDGELATMTADTVAVIAAARTFVAGAVGSTS